MRMRIRRVVWLARHHWKRALPILAAIAVIALVVYWAILPYESPEWTGFDAYDQDETRPREKKLWDWLELLIIPVVLAGGATLFTSARIRADRKAAEEKQWEDRLQTYIERMTELLLRKDGLRESKPEDVIRDIARTLTLSTIRTLDGTRKGFLLRFLHESKLIDAEGEGQESKDPIVMLKGANLVRVNLVRVNLEGADLRSAFLRGANLRGSFLRGADLRDAFLRDAFLRSTNLRGTNLRGAFLGDAFLEGADLRGVDLRRANLTDAQVADAQLAQAKSLEGATMPDGTRYDGTIAGHTVVA